MDNHITLYEVAAFTDQPTAGSPTGVVLNADGLSTPQMQAIANGLSYSHTAFITEDHPDNNSITIRFFTPLKEIKNCGHATIAAHFLRTIKYPKMETAHLTQKTISGVQQVEIRRQDQSISVHFKQQPIQFEAANPPIMQELLNILGISEADLDAHIPIILASPGTNRFLVALDSPATLQSLSPDFAALKALCDRLGSIGCFAFTMTSSLEANARMFAPSIGINEDIINGNSSGCLGAYLLHLDQHGKHEIQLRVHQGQAFNREGTVLVEASRVENHIQTIIGGKAVLISESKIPLP